MPPCVTILWEDECAGRKPREFGPHVLLRACVAAQRGSHHDRFHLQDRLVSRACKGNGNLKRTIAEELDLLLDQGPVVAVFDDDKVRRLYALAPDACRRRVLDAIDHLAPAFRIVLLESNIETLVDVCRRELQGSDDAPQPGAAPVRKPDPTERDRLLHAAAASLKVLETLRTKVPSFDRLVRIVAALLPQA